MAETYGFPINELNNEYFPNSGGGMKFEALTPQIEKVLIKSLVTSFGLDAMLQRKRQM